MQNFSLNSALGVFQETFEIKGEVGRLVDIATADTLIGPDWQMNDQICDKIEANPKDGAKDFSRSIRKRIKNKNPKVALLALTLLDYTVKKCGHELHMQIGSKEFMEELQSIIVAQNGDMEVHRKILALIQMWGEGFKHLREDLPAFFDTYAALRSQGIRFPEYDPTTAPKFGGSPQRKKQREPRDGAGAHGSSSYGISGSPGASGTQSRSSASSTGEQQGSRPRNAHQLPESRSERKSQPAREREREEDLYGHSSLNVDKLKEDLELVTVEASMLCDALEAATNGDEDRERSKIIAQLYRNCSIYQPRLSTLLGQVQDEEIMLKMLSINDELTRVLDMHKCSNAVSHRTGGTRKQEGKPKPEVKINAQDTWGGRSPPKKGESPPQEHVKIPTIEKPKAKPKNDLVDVDDELVLLGLAGDMPVQTKEAPKPASSRQHKGLGAKPLGKKAEATSPTAGSDAPISPPNKSMSTPETKSSATATAATTPAPDGEAANALVDLDF